ncbi:MAG TPA: hypothetical protein VEQ63_11270, partial [Bryobacteraceae bacterium]|nr:hypothetical protein [Bryobacteraceae bacterium]
LTVAILGNTLLRHWNLTMAYTNFCFRYERRMAIMAIVDGAVTVAGSYMLIKYLGPIGAPLGSIIGVSLVSIPSNAITLTGEIRMPLSHLLKPLWPWFWRFVLLIGGIGYISSIWMPDTILGMAAAAIAVSAVYSAVMIGPLLRSPLSAYTRPLVAKARDAARRVLPLRPSVTVSDEAGS